ncbi:MAG: HD domain-containing protein [Phycisphaerales bacterium]
MTSRRSSPGPRKRIASNPPMPLWQAAVAFAFRAHRHQFRKDGATPYSSHLMRVVLTVTEIFGCRDEEVIAIAVLHDTIEDTTTDYDDLLERFGKNVADGVAALTKNMAMEEAAREAEYDARLAKASWGVRLVKLADSYDNLCDIPNLRVDPTLAGRKALGPSTERAIARARRAIALATPDAAQHQETRTAIVAISKLIDSGDSDSRPHRSKRSRG